MKIGFFEEAEGVKSSLRLMSFLSFIVSVAFSFIAFQFEHIGSEHLTIIFGFLVGAFAPKVVQKFAEEKIK